MKKGSSELGRSGTAIVVAVIVSVVVFGIAYLYINLALILQHAVLYAPQPPQPNSTVVVAADLQLELNSSLHYGFALNASAFASYNASGCSLQLVSGCNNNVPSQFVCVNSAYAGEVAGQYANIYRQPRVCAAYFMEGTLGCAVSSGYCVVTKATTAPGTT